MARQGPLSGFRIIDVCRAGPGRIATAILADYGADVITVVQPGYAESRARGGAGNTELGRINHRNKRSVLLDLKTGDGRDALFTLVAAADAMVESNRPGVAARLGIEYEHIKELNPSIVYVSLSGWGQDGPYARVPAHDVSFQAVAGSVPLDEDGVPFMPPLNVADRNAAHYAAIAILTGLLERSRSEDGQQIDVSFVDVSIQIPPGRMRDDMLHGVYPGYNIYETADGRYLSLSIREFPYWERWCELVDHKEWIPHIRPEGELRDTMFAEMRSVIKGRTLAEWMPILLEAEMEFGPVNASVDELVSDPQLAARGILRRGYNPVSGETPLEAGPALRFSRTRADIWREATVMGHDTDVILSQLAKGESTWPTVDVNQAVE
jgi:crotonobetainyl-CoA:carnitine CoA-transferase CaiB-like acyl-CoA transferase